MDINTITDYVKADYKDKFDLNCAETILYGANKAYNLNLDKNDLKVAAGFGGGMGIEETCGALTGGIMALGVLFVEDNAHDSEISDFTEKVFNKYEEEMGSIVCAPLKEQYRTEESGCYKVILKAAEIFDEIIQKNKSLII